MKMTKPFYAPGRSVAIVGRTPPAPSSPLEASEPDLRARLSRAEETLRAIRCGEVDALVVRDASSDAQVFTLSSADRPYRLFVDNMRDGAATVSQAGIILYANLSLAELAGRPLVELIGSPVGELLAEGGVAALQQISGPSGGTIEVEIVTESSQTVPVWINAWSLDVGDHVVLSLTFADLTQRNAHRHEIQRRPNACASSSRASTHSPIRPHTTRSPDWPTGRCSSTEPRRRSHSPIGRGNRSG
jgi:PAS domain S-box-containing protein